MKCFSSLTDKINVHYSSNFLDNHKADKYFHIFEKYLVYNSSEDSKVIVYGKEYEIKRKQVAYGDDGTFYEFAGTKVYAKSWNNKDDIICRVIKNIKHMVELFTLQKFNFVLINRYADGNDKIGKHQDSNKNNILGDDPTIVGVSFGAARDVIFKPYSTPTNPGIIPKHMNDKISIRLDHGSIFVMYPPTNTYWTHEIPKKANINTPRISLTFRYLHL